MTTSDDEPAVVRRVEYYDSTVVLSAGIILRRAAGWSARSAGRVDDTTFWVEFEGTEP